MSYRISVRTVLPQDGYVVYIQRYSGLWEWGEYSSFSVGQESDKYRLSVSGFSGDAGDALAGHPHPFIFANGMQFSTPGHDNDRIAGNCAASGKGTTDAPGRSSTTTLMPTGTQSRSCLSKTSRLPACW